MPTLLEDTPPIEAAHPAAERLRTTMAATKVSFTWFGVRKSLSPAQKERAADSFAAEATFLSAAKKLLDTRHEAYQAVTTVRGQALHFWRSLTLPYPESGIRLIRQDDLRSAHAWWKKRPAAVGRRRRFSARCGRPGSWLR